MNTVFLLMAEFGTADIPLEKVAPKYLSKSAERANADAARHRLPFPVYRAGSQKSPYLVRVTDLADHLDKERAKAELEWKKINGKAA